MADSIDNNGVVTDTTSNALVRVCDSFFKRVDGGYRFAIRTYSGNIKVYSSPFVIKLPACEAKLIYIKNITREVVYTDSVKTADDVTVTCASPFEFHYHVHDDALSIKKVFQELNADKLVKDLVKTIVDLVVTNSNSKVVKHKFSISKKTNDHRNFDVNVDFFVDDGKLDENVRRRIVQYFKLIYEQYGIILDRIVNLDFDEPSKIVDAETDAKAQSIRNKTAMEKAKNDYEINMLSAKLEKIKREYDYETLYAAATKFKLSSDEIYEILKRQFTQANTTIIESNGGFDSIIAAILSGFKAYSLERNKGVIGDESTSRELSTDISHNEGSDVIDVDYTEDDNMGPRKK